MNIEIISIFWISIFWKASLSIKNHQKFEKQKPNKVYLVLGSSYTMNFFNFFDWDQKYTRCDQKVR